MVRPTPMIGVDGDCHIGERPLCFYSQAVAREPLDLAKAVGSRLGCVASTMRARATLRLSDMWNSD